MPYAAVTLAQLRTALTERYASIPYWSTTEANDAINEALRYFNMYTGYWRGSVNIITTVNTVFYNVSNTMTRATRLYRSGKALGRKSIVELYRQRRNWRTQTTASGGGVPTTVQEWAPVGLNQIAIWPAHAAGGLTLTLDAVKITPVLTADGQFLDLGQEELDALLDECMWILTFKRPSMREAMKPRHEHFLRACLERNDQLRQSSHFRHVLGLDQEQRLVPTREKKTGADDAQA